MSATLAPPPIQTELVEPPQFGKPPSWKITKSWSDWFNLTVLGRLQAAPNGVVSVRLQGKSAALPVTALVPSANAGLYRITAYARVTIVASVNSSLIPTLTFIQGGVTCTIAGAALTSNLTNLPATWTFFVRSDGSSPISYSTAYVSNLAGMTYDVDFTVEQL